MTGTQVAQLCRDDAERQARLSNALVEQNDTIRTMIAYAEDAAELERAVKMIDFVQNVWTELGYSYKLVEIRNRVVDRATQLAIAERQYIAGCPKNDKTLNGSRMNLSRLESLGG